MARWGMAIDLDRCTGCAACVVACKMENNLPPATEAEAARGRVMSWIRVPTLHEVAGSGLTPLPCLHCDNPPCTRVCPTGATYKNDEGIVAQIYPRCIGCRYCTTACPYTVKVFNWSTPKWPEGAEVTLNPDVSVRPRGVVEKCTLCHHRLQRAHDEARAEGRGLQPGDYTPACVQACPARAMVFGDLDDPTSQMALLAGSSRAFRLLEELGTRPKVIHLREGE